MSTDLAEELKIQSVRDLEQAKSILKQGENLEHVAWFCEQSYEKLIKHVYAHFKIKIQNRSVSGVYDKIFRAGHYDSPDLVLNMLGELAREFWDMYNRGLSVLPKLSDSDRTILKRFIDNVPQDALRRNERHIESIRRKIDMVVNKDKEFESFLRNSTYEKLHESMMKYDYNQIIDQTVAKNTAGLEGLVGVDPNVLMKGINSQLYKDYYLFVAKLLGLAEWLLPNISGSRYPLRESGFGNLKLYRELNDQLILFFGYMVSILDGLQTGKDRFISSIISILKTGSDQH
ncbi:hypothetical protein Ngar_c12440 [Candidatus Nitrososphaera gargensis Ga9.2]|uniref:HEPN domain-containing protein n=1 Tax=Nitrososphaera gargensis (strain Ga9.2) TaxID=1237085 RepID=K0IMT5_NITGG|nr:hypothetical protein [Candidatus Nitrososphaera gargensis]AFU58184.1 hypothetical protein Ngar_c12440 [Candidatus Nitrososphaera gargensis Ga9.2]